MIEIYQQALKEHNKHPVGMNKPIKPSHFAEGYNASCGDELTIQLLLTERDQTILNISFACDCCAICKASASALCQVVVGQHINYLKQQTELLTGLLQNSASKQSTSQEFDSALTFLLPVSKHISRISCALLPWQTAVNASRSRISNCQ